MKSIFDTADFQMVQNANKSYTNTKRVYVKPTVGQSGSKKETQQSQQELNIDRDVVKQSAQPYMSHGFGGDEPHSEPHSEPDDDIGFKEEAYRYIDKIMAQEREMQLSGKDLLDDKSVLRNRIIDVINSMLYYKFSSRHPIYRSRVVPSKITDENSKDIINDIYNIFNKLADDIKEYRLEQYEYRLEQY